MAASQTTAPPLAPQGEPAVAKGMQVAEAEMPVEAAAEDTHERASSFALPFGREARLKSVFFFTFLVLHVGFQF